MFLNCSMFGLGIYRRLSEVDLNALWCISAVCWNSPCKYSGARLLKILNKLILFLL